MVIVEASDARANPIDFSAGVLTGNTGTHILDVEFALRDLLDAIAARQ